MISVATPIQFQHDSTKVYLEDYFTDPTRIDSIQTQLKYYWNKKSSTITFIENPSSAIDNIRFWIENVFMTSLLLKVKNKKLFFKFSCKKTLKFLLWVVLMAGFQKY